MRLDEKIAAFKEELDFIKSPDIRNFAEGCINLMPDYFFTIPASSTGKYHPNYALGDGGLLRHTKAFVRIAVELFRTDLWAFTEEEKDLIITAAIVHDGRKSGNEQQKFTVVEHPILMADAIEHDPSLAGVLPDVYIQKVTDGIRTHMGKWTKDFKSNREVLETPKTTMQRFIHLCDYIASRKALEYNFDVKIERDEK